MVLQTAPLIFFCFFSGKTSFLLKLFQHKDIFFEKVPTVLLYFYKENDPKFRRFKFIPGLKVVFYQGAPQTLEEMKNIILEYPKEQHKLIGSTI